MKKLTALLLTLMMLLSCLLLCATAEEEPNLYRLYTELLGNREITLTVNAENVVGLEDNTGSLWHCCLFRKAGSRENHCPRNLR